MAVSKPGVVIVPGAFYSPWHYRHLHNGLEAAGYTVTTIALPSTGGEVPQPDGTADFAVAAGAIKTHIDLGRDVVVVMHSWGGFAGNCASKGLLPGDAVNGKGVVGLVHICSAVPTEGMSVMDGSGGRNFPWARLIGEDAQPNSGVFMSCDDPGEIFFHDCEPDERAEAVKRFQYWSEGCLWTKATFAGWREVDSSYLILTDDRALPTQRQEKVSRLEGGKWKYVERIVSGHSPFLSRPEETLNFVRKCCGEKI